MPDICLIIEEENIVRDALVGTLDHCPVLDPPELVRHLLVGYVAQLYEMNKYRGISLVCGSSFKLTNLYNIMDEMDFTGMGYERPENNDIALARLYAERKTGLLRRIPQDQYTGRSGYLYSIPSSDRQMDRLAEWRDTTMNKKPKTYA